MTAFVGGVVVLLSVSFAARAFARDASLPYRNYPGFQCHQWNRSGECSDWSYFDEKMIAPTRYVLPYSRPTSVQNTYVAPRTSAWPATTRCGLPTEDCTGAISVRVTANPNPVPRSELLTYSIYVRNDDSQMRTYTVRAYLDDIVGFESATYGGYSDGKVIRWDAQRLAPKTSRSMILRVRVRENASLNLPVLLRVQADRSTDSVSVAVADSDEWYFDNAVKYTDSGVYAPYGHPRRYRKVDQYQPRYFYDSAGNLHYRSTTTTNYNGQGTFYCDSTRFVCR